MQFLLFHAIVLQAMTIQFSMLPDLLNLRSVPGLGSHPTSKSAKKHHLTYIHTSTYMISTNRKLSSKLNNGLGFNTETEKLTNSHTDVHTYIHTYIHYLCSYWQIHCIAPQCCAGCERFDSLKNEERGKQESFLEKSSVNKTHHIHTYIIFKNKFLDTYTCTVYINFQIHFFCTSTGYFYSFNTHIHKYICLPNNMTSSCRHSVVSVN